MPDLYIVDGPMGSGVGGVEIQGDRVLLEDRSHWGQVFMDVLFLVTSYHDFCFLIHRKRNSSSLPRPPSSAMACPGA